MTDYRISILEKLILKIQKYGSAIGRKVFNVKRVYTYLVAKGCQKVGSNLRVNGPARGFGKNVILGQC